MSRLPTAGIDYTDKDYEAFRTMMIQKLQEKLPEYTDTSQTDAGIVIIECLANGLDVLSMYNDIIANDLFLPTTQDRKIAVMLAKQLGYTPKNQTASVIKQVFVLSSISTTNTVIPKGTVVHTKESSDAVTVYFETEDDLVIPASKLGNETDTDGNYLYTVNVVQGSTISEDLLGTSNGQPYQSFKLNYPEVLTDSIQLNINEGSGFTEWTQVNSLLDYDEADTVYTVNVDEFDYCYIEFGSGTRGKIPSIYTNGILASYRIGGGTIGNVQANTITVLQDNLAFVSSTFNPYAPSVLGHEKEAIEEIRENGPASFRTRDRAITEKDYADLLKANYYEVIGAVGITNTTTALKMDLYYQMRSGYSMTSDLLASITSFFSTRIIPGTTLELKAGVAYPLALEATLILDNDYSIATLTDYVDSYVRDTYFAEGNFTFNSKFVKSDLENAVRTTFKGVESFRITSPNGTGILEAPNSYQILTVGSLNITVVGGK